ncbi:MAG TPA: hypothetical protein VMF32_25215 [Xanthobacteraceae bacterium]|nr:hypothetical protein [Xanthobacteraceae bacterium]
MRRALPIIFFCIATIFAQSVDAEPLRANGGELFCRDRKKFPEYLATVNDKKSDDRTVDGCKQLRKGVRYEVIDAGVETGIDKVRLLGGRRAIDGYMLVEGR